jgi:hypothetical protein
MPQGGKGTEEVFANGLRLGGERFTENLLRPPLSPACGRLWHNDWLTEEDFQPGQEAIVPITQGKFLQA